MKTYVIHRPNGWATKNELEVCAKKSADVGNNEMADKVRWIRSYVTHHEGGRLGTVCVYQAVNSQALIDHARRVGMPCDTALEVADTVIVRPDPSVVN